MKVEEMNTNNEVDVIDLEPEKVTMVTNVSEESEGDSNFGKALIGTVVGIAALAGGYLYATRDKRKDKKKAKAKKMLEEDGYTVYKPDVEDDNNDVVDVEADEMTESED